MKLPGTPSDEVDGVLAAGPGDIGTLFVSMATPPSGRADADYLRWHTLDHRPEQHRLSAVRASLAVGVHAGLPGRAGASDDRFDAIDHVMTYFFTDQAGWTGFLELSKALGGAGPQAASAAAGTARACTRCRKVAAPRVKIGADVLPWWPTRGCTCCWRRTHRRRPEPGRCRRRCRCLVGASAGCRREAWRVPPRARRSRTASSTTTRSPPRSGCGRARRTLAASQYRTSARSTLLSRRALRVGSLCAIGGSHAHRLDGRLRQGALTSGPADRAARRRKGRRGRRFRIVLDSRRYPAISTR